MEKLQEIMDKLADIEQKAFYNKMNCPDDTKAAWNQLDCDLRQALMNINRLTGLRIS